MKLDCVDETNGATDMDGLGCDSYKDIPIHCGCCDDEDLKANSMCCACKASGK